ncbi:hypothetical protein BH10BAC1_BH10BAC1_05730 [soil metagenome]
MIDLLYLKRHFPFFALCAFCINTFQSFSQTDTSKSKKHLSIPPTITNITNLSASYVNYKNWKYNGYSNYTFLARENLNYDTLGSNWETHIRFNGELGYMKFLDSVWYKNTDYLDLSTEIVKTKNKFITNLFTLYFNSQFLSTYDDYYKDDGTISNRWSGGFGNPMNLEIGYGSTIRFWKTCRINLTFITLRTNIIPALDNQSIITKNDFIYEKSIISSEYGLGIQTFVRHDLFKKIRWENSTRFFGNAINRQHFDIDFRNRLIFHLIKYLDFIIDTRIRYMPYPPYKLQFRNELMLSFSLEKL